MARQARKGGARGARAAGAALLALVAACGEGAAPGATQPPAAPANGMIPTDAAPTVGELRRVDLLVVDQDAGATLPDGGRTGVLFLAHATGENYELRPVATDPRWLDPADALRLPDGSWLVLESRWPTGEGEARGALFHLPSLSSAAAPELWWTDARTRQPVSVVRDSEGTIFVSDRDADPSGVRAAEPGRQRTGCVFGIEVGADGRPSRTAVVAAGPQLFTPGVLLASGPMLLLMDADANPRGLRMADGRLATPGVLFDLVRSSDGDRLAPRTLHDVMECSVTTSPIGLIERVPPDFNRKLRPPPTRWSGALSSDELPGWLPDLLLIDANYGTQPSLLGDGAIFRIQFRVEDREEGGQAVHALAADLHLLADTTTLGAHALVDPAYGCQMYRDWFALADANADPKHLGPDGTNKGVYGKAHGAILAWTPGRQDRIEVLIADSQLVTPVAVRTVEPLDTTWTR
jgi:hypothetical protein